MQTEMDNNDNLVIKGLEALLGGEDSTDFSQNKSFEDMRTKFKDSFSLDQSKDSGVAFANLSYRHLPSVNTSIQNQSMESGYSCDLFDTPFSFKPSVRNVSFDGCFIEDDFTPLAGDIGAKYKGKWGTSQTGILSSAVSHGGDLKSQSSSSSLSIQEAYTRMKHAHTMKQCWNSICCIHKLRHQLTQKTLELEKPVEEWNLIWLLDTFKKEIVEVNKAFNGTKLMPVLHEVQNSLDLISSNVGGQLMDWRMLNQLQRLTSNVFVALYCHCVLENSLSTPSEDKFRSEKRFQIWNSLA